MLKRYFFVAVFTFLLGGASFAAHPLITDDAGTQGKGNRQFEFNYEYAKDSEGGVREEASELAVIFSYGINDRADIVLTLPYQFIKVKEAGSTARTDGVSDAGAELKWRFYEKDGLGLAIKPGITLPTGDEDEGLGTGEIGWTAFFIATREFERLALHFNAGYMRNNNDFGEEEDLWHLSLASEWAAGEKLTLVGNIGSERNTDNGSDDPLFLLGGFIYNVSENFDVSAGVKIGLNEAETDYAVPVGIAYRF